ncbi:hypothetical protein [Halegenticoccus soli]|uniref:hypothetical protein n=1 Tax=Halegenticoccus soli TaxID=1985678 RepID=UPI000C6E4A9F|nr:hypothetical protein [Halegenticoccus soli]
MDGELAFDELAEMAFAADPAVRWVAVGRAGDEPRSAYRPGVEPANPDASDEAEERIVNPAILTLAEGRGEWDVGGVEYVIVAYGAVTQVVLRLPEGRHLSVSLEKTADACRIAERLVDRLAERPA